jgi:MinD-like ATPase involved in chromosome partitioning or flagellar assembly
VAVIGFTGGKGAPGVTLAVATIGVSMARAKRSVIAVDLDPAGGVLSAYLGADPERGLWPLARVGAEPTAERLAREVQRVEGLDLLAGLPRAGDAVGLDVVQAARVARGLAQTVLVDAGRLPGPGVAVLGVCDQVVLVVRPDAVGVLAAEQALVALGPGLTGRAVLLVSGLRGRRKRDLRELVAFLNLPLLGVVPWAPEDIRKARERQRQLAGAPAKALRKVSDALGSKGLRMSVVAHGTAGLGEVIADGAN